MNNVCSFSDSDIIYRVNLASPDINGDCTSIESFLECGLGCLYQETSSLNTCSLIMNGSGGVGDDVNSSCLFPKLVTDSQSPVFSDDSLINDADLLNMEDIYQVLGKDILKSTLLDDIDLYLECDEDGAHTVLPRMDHSAAMKAGCEPGIGISLHDQLSLNGLSRRFKCDACDKTFTRDSLRQDHRFKVHGVRDLFPCLHCPYKAQVYRALSKHVRRQHCPVSTSIDTRVPVDKTVERSNAHIPNIVQPNCDTKPISDKSGITSKQSHFFHSQVLKTVLHLVKIPTRNRWIEN